MSGPAVTAILRGVRLLSRRFGIDIVRHQPNAALPRDFSPDDAALVAAVAPYTMTSPERIFALVRAVEHVVRAQVPGAIAECGVWRGGSMMAVALTLQRLRAAPRHLFLFDTFTGMVEPDHRDIDATGTHALEEFQRHRAVETSPEWCAVGEPEVRANMGSTGYPEAHVYTVAGRVEDTLPEHAPEQIAVLRLDTDWYESTRHELMHLYPRVMPGGVIIIDDYGYWSGCRQATDEFLAALPVPVMLHRVDDTCRLFLKP